MKRRFLFALSVSIILIFAVSCGSGGTENDLTEKTASISDNGAPGIVTTVDPFDDNLPIADFDGYEFRFYTFGNSGDMYVPDSESGDVVNDAVYRRNSAVEERFNIDIKAINSNAANQTAQATAIGNIIMAGSEDFDIALNIGKPLAGESVLGHFVNLREIEHLDFTKPWWSEKLVDDLTFNNKMFIASNNLHYEEFAASKVYYFNKDKIKSYNLDDPYDITFAGDWTIDRMISMTRDVYEDVNGDGKYDTGDFYGMLTTISHNTWSVAFDIPEWEKRGDNIEIVALSEKMLSAFDKIHDYFFNSTGLYTWNSYSAAQDEMRKMFIDGNGLFAFGFVGDSGNYYRETEVDYGIVPFPKWDESQQEYRVFFGVNTSNMFAVPIFASDTSRTGIIIEALSAEGYKQLIPAYYEIALKDKYLRDEPSIKMLDLITECRTISFSYCYDNYNAGIGFGNCFPTTHKDNYTSFFASRENLLTARIADVLEAFSDK